MPSGGGVPYSRVVGNEVWLAGVGQIRKVQVRWLHRVQRIWPVAQFEGMVPTRLPSFSDDSCKFQVSNHRQWVSWQNDLESSGKSQDDVLIAEGYAFTRGQVA